MLKSLFLAALAFIAIGVSRAQDRSPVVGVGTGATVEEATIEAYLSAFDAELLGVLGQAAVRTAGERYRRAAERDLGGFKRRYFSSDTVERCIPQGTTFMCEVQGGFNRAALQVDAADLIASTGGASYVFVASAAENSDPRTNFVVDRLNGEFAGYNHRIVSGAAVATAIRNGDADFSLAIYEVSFSEFQFDPNLGRSTGALTVRFRLNDLSTDEALAVTPVAVSGWVTGDNHSALEDLLVADLSSDAARQIARVVNAETAEYASRRESVNAAETLSALGRSSFSIRVIGVNRRDAADRNRLRSLRDQLGTVAGVADVETDFASSSENETLVRFTAPSESSPQDLIDALYDAFAEEPEFYADYFGGEEYEVNF